MGKLAKDYLEMRGLPEWKSLRKAMRKAKRRGAKCMTLDVLDAQETLEEAVVDALAMKALAPGAKPAILIPC